MAEMVETLSFGDDTVAKLTDEEPVDSQSQPAPAAPIENRFLFVNVAAKRAVQLRKGARPRVEPADGRKAERLAMQEIQRGLIPYELPAAAENPDLSRGPE